MSLPELVTNVDPYDKRVIFVSASHELVALEKLILRVLSGPPQSVSIVIGTAPHRSTVMVVEQDHNTCFCQYLDGLVKDLN